MKILILSLNYFPELTGIGKYTGEMSEWLAQRGHEVRVVTAPPYYPDWRIFQGFSAWRYRREVLNGVEIFRAPLWVPAQPSGAKRLFHLASFAFSSFFALLPQIFWRPDVVFAVEPPLFCAPAAWLLARLTGAAAWLHVQDFEVDAAFELGILRSRRLKNFVLSGERFLLAKFDRVSTISRKMVERLEEKGVPPERRIYFPNWADTDSIFPAESRLRQELGISRESVVCLYSGSMGEKQGIEILAQAARLLATDNVFFVFCGRGGMRRRLELAAQDLPNVAWLDLQPTARLNDLLNLADIHLLPEREGAADLVMPSKLMGMIASGRPVVATAKAGTQIAALLENCGIIIPPNDAQALAGAILMLVRDPELREKLGAAARRLAVSDFSKEAVLLRFEEVLRS